jgi:hypothetical protein
MKTARYFVIFLAIISMSLVACQKKARQKPRISGYTRGPAPGDTQPDINNDGTKQTGALPYGVNPWDTIVPRGQGFLVARNSDGSDGTESMAKALASATVSPDEIGQIMAGDVVIYGLLKLNGNCQSGSANIDSALSLFGIVIWDSIALQDGGQTVPPVPIAIFPGYNNAQFSGGMNNGNLSIQMSDSFGTLHLNAYLNGNTLLGTLSFQNNSNYGGAAGSFDLNISAGSLLTCN